MWKEFGCVRCVNYNLKLLLDLLVVYSDYEYEISQSLIVRIIIGAKKIRSLSKDSHFNFRWPS